MPPEPADEEEDDTEPEEDKQEEVQVPPLNQSRDGLNSNESNTADDAPWAASNETLANYVGVSTATMARVETILEDRQTCF
jgi:hypothetical protein